MGSRSPQTQLKRARELAVKERRERKLAKKQAKALDRREPDQHGDEQGDEQGWATVAPPA